MPRPVSTSPSTSWWPAALVAAVSSGCGLQLDELTGAELVSLHFPGFSGPVIQAIVGWDDGVRCAQLAPEIVLSAEGQVVRPFGGGWNTDNGLPSCAHHAIMDFGFGSVDNVDISVMDGDTPAATLTLIDPFADRTLQLVEAPPFVEGTDVHFTWSHPDDILVKPTITFIGAREPGILPTEVRQQGGAFVFTVPFFGAQGATQLQLNVEDFRPGMRCDGGENFTCRALDSRFWGSERDFFAFGPQPLVTVDITTP